MANEKLEELMGIFSKKTREEMITAWKYMFENLGPLWRKTSDHNLGLTWRSKSGVEFQHCTAWDRDNDVTITIGPLVWYRSRSGSEGLKMWMNGMRIEIAEKDLVPQVLIDTFLRNPEGINVPAILREAAASAA